VQTDGDAQDQVDDEDEGTANALCVGDIVARAHDDEECAHFHYYLMRISAVASVVKPSGRKKQIKDDYGKVFRKGDLVVRGHLLEPDTLDEMGADSYCVDTQREAICFASEILTDRFSNAPVRVLLERVDEDDPDHLMLDQALHDSIMKTITG
jgi:hypothetical protein